ncbi:MAG: CocE/NonD family hydrolase [Pseudomonadota bacterium]
MRVERSHFVEMRDGVRLMTDLYFPVGHDEPLPVILERTPYDKAVARNSDPDAPINNNNKAWYYASHGYVFAVQDRRGKFESESDYTMGHGDIQDAEDTLDWFETQDWFSGRVGMIGCSIPGGNVIKAAMSGHNSLKGLVPQSAGFGHGTAGGTLAYGFIRGGVQNGTMPFWAHGAGSKLFYRPSKRLSRAEYLRVADMFEPRPQLETGMLDFFQFDPFDMTEAAYDALLHLPTVDIDDVLGSPPSDWDDLVGARPTDPFWQDGDYLDDGETVAGAALHVNSWHDYSVNETLLQFEHFRQNADTEWARDNQYVLIGPLGHCVFEGLTDQTTNGDRYMGDARFDAWGTYLRWWDYTLKEQANGFEDTPAIQYFLPGANEWRSSDQWPIAGTTPTRLYLRGDAPANSREGGGALGWTAVPEARTDTYTYDPLDPIMNFRRSVLNGSFDQTRTELRQDRLVYTSPPLEEDFEITGKARARIYISTDVPDTDLMVKLMDVYPDGAAYAIQHGYIRLRYRDGFDREVMMEPGTIYPIDLDMLVGANLFKAGHRIRIEVASSYFPNYMRNLNTGGDNARETETRPARVTIHQGADTPSYVELPKIERGEP